MLTQGHDEEVLALTQGNQGPGPTHGNSEWDGPPHSLQLVNSSDFVSTSHQDEHGTWQYLGSNATLVGHNALEENNYSVEMRKSD